MMGRARWIVLAGALATGCSGLLPPSGPEPDELAEIKSRILELQRTAAMTRVELDRLRQEMAALAARLPGVAEPPAPVAELAPPGVINPPPPPEPPVVEVSDLEPGPAPAAAPPEPSVAAPVAPPSPPAAATAESTVSPAAQALYDRGYTLYHQGRYVDAEAGFRRFLQTYPENSLSDNAQYWIGESRYARGEFEAALAAFQETVERYPAGNKAADSLLKAADCLRRLGDEESARSGYDEVMRRFPGSAAAAAAEERRGRGQP